MFSALISVETKSELLDPPQSLKLGRIDQANHQSSFDAVIAQRNDVMNWISIDSRGQVFFLLLTESSTVKASVFGPALPSETMSLLLHFQQSVCSNPLGVPFFGHEKRIFGSRI